MSHVSFYQFIIYSFLLLLIIITRHAIESLCALTPIVFTHSARMASGDGAVAASAMPAGAGKSLDTELHTRILAEIRESPNVSKRYG